MGGRILKEWTYTEQQIIENINAINEGKLNLVNLPFSILRKEKPKEFNKLVRKYYEQSPKRKYYMKAYQQAYQQTPEYRARKKAYQQTPKFKAYQQAYQQTPEYKARKKAYQQTPKFKAYKKAYYQKNRERILENVRRKNGHKTNI